MKKIHLLIIVYLLLVDVHLQGQEQDTLPTFMTGIEYADPSEGVAIIEAPIPNSTGSANLSHPIKLPGGRRGMTPDLSIDYQNNSGHSWLGTDWNIPSSQISVDTRWGVPRFSPNLETETYLYNGQQLHPSAHRLTQPRNAEKTFSPRILRDFEQIVRHGNRPDNYWWEVTAKNGQKYSYGGSSSTGIIESAVWRGQGNNIAIWELTRIEDADGNFIAYFYDKVTETRFTGVQVYLKKIEYTGFENEPGKYRVEFIRDQELGEKQRTDIDVNSRYGRAQVCAQLLKKISISFQTDLIRSYKFEYKSGAFDKTLLKAIVEYDKADQEFYRHSFEYYNDIVEQRYGDPMSWTVANDNVVAPIANPIPGFTGESSMIGASSSSYITGGATITVGPIGDPTSKRFSAGPSGGYASSISEGLLSLVDINGDGLPDKVFKEEGVLYYRPNLFGIGQKAFGERSVIQGVSDFTVSKTQSILVGAEVNAGVAFAGYEYNNSTITSDTYFADYNGDGLTDIVYEGTVFFNHIEDGSPVFTTNSNDTPNPIVSGSLPNLVIKPDTVDKSQLFPLHDIVRFWQAPCDGTINIIAPVTLLEIKTAQAKNYQNKDGVMVSVQLNAAPIWNTRIEPNDFSEKMPDLTNISINEGDRIYFRVHSIYDGAYDQVIWDPAIEYVTGPEPGRDANNYDIAKYKASSDFLLAAPAALIVPQNGTISIATKFKKPKTSDSLEVRITRIRDSIPMIIYTQEMPFDRVIDTTWTVEALEVEREDELYFQVAASTQIDWAAIEW